jgi:histidine ammonia-lyase
VVENVRTILAIELLAAGQGVDLLRPLASSAALEALHRDLRLGVARWDEDREMAPDIAWADAFLRAGIRVHLAALR